MKQLGGIIVFMMLSMFLLTVPLNGLSAALPKSTQEMLKKLKLDPSILADIDKELKVPMDWIEMAKNEQQLRILSTPQPSKKWEIFLSPFRERYPFIAIQHSGASREARSVRPLLAIRAGRIPTDVLFGIGGLFHHWKEANALVDLRNIPAMKNVPNGAKDPSGLWVGINTLYWCMAYNTRLVKKEELPKKWEDLLTNPIWRDGNLALGNRPHLWAFQLWAKDESWTKDFLTRLFTEVKPQLRKEGMRALTQLAAAGEFHAVIPSNAARSYKTALEGAPVGFNCPSPVPASTQEAIILRGTPNLNAARIFINWLLSKEGQIAQYSALKLTPVRKDLERPEFIPFAEQILGKELLFHDPGLETQLLPRLTEHWNNLWLRRR